MGLEKQSEISPPIPQPALLKQARIPFAQRILRYAPHSWRLLAAVGLVAAGSPFVRPASADTLNNPSTITTVFKTATPLTEAEKQQIPPDFAVNQGKGHFFTQTRGNAEFPKGFLMQRDFYDTLLRLGGVPLLGYPVANELTIDGFRVDPTQNGILQDNPRLGGMVLANTMDIAHAKGLDNWLYAQGVPLHFSGDDGSKGNFETAKQIRLSWLTVPQIRDKYFQNPNPDAIPSDKWDPITFYGLPTSQPEDRGAFIAQRFQRGAILYWKQAVAGGQPPGTVQLANVGDLLKTAGLYGQAAIPIDNPFGTGGTGSGSVNGPEQSGLSYPKEVGDRERDGIVLHNLSNEIGVIITDQLYFQEKIVPLIKKYRPKGVEFFFHDGKTTLNVPNKGYKSYRTISYFLRLDDNSFLGDTGVVFAERASDGILEVHYDLRVTNQNPEPETIRRISYSVERSGIIRYIWGDDNLRQPDIRALEIELTNRVVAGGDPVFKLKFNNTATPIGSSR